MRASLSAMEARGLALRAQSFASPPPDQPVELLERLGAIQLDSVNVLARAQLLTAYARLGPYSVQDLYNAIYARAPGVRVLGPHGLVAADARVPLLPVAHAAHARDHAPVVGQLPRAARGAVSGDPRSHPRRRSAGRRRLRGSARPARHVVGLEAGQDGPRGPPGHGRADVRQSHARLRAALRPRRTRACRLVWTPPIPASRRPCGTSSSAASSGSASARRPTSRTTFDSSWPT